MKKIIVDFGKSYNEQSKEVKETFCEQDFHEIANLLNFKKRLKKVLTNNQAYDIIIIEREKRGRKL